MIIKINARFLLFLVAGLFISLNAWSSEIEIQQVLEKPTIEYLEGGVKIPALPKLKLNQSFRAYTAHHQLLKMRLSEKFILIIFPNSKIKVEGFENEKNVFEVKKVTFLSGQFYVQNFDSHSVLFESDLFSWQHGEAHKYEEFYLELNLGLPLLRVCAGETGLNIKLFEFEVEKNLKKEQGAEFQGVIEKSEISFDHLVAGRKIPKGEWKKDFTCNFKNILQQVVDIESEVKKNHQNQIMKEKKEKARKKEQYDKSLCHEPNGLFNQCWWKKSKNECFRYKCNAEGKWADQYLVPQKEISVKCSSKNKVAACDY